MLHTSAYNQISHSNASYCVPDTQDRCCKHKDLQGRLAPSYPTAESPAMPFKRHHRANIWAVTNQQQPTLVRQQVVNSRLDNEHWVAHSAGLTIWLVCTADTAPCSLACSSQRCEHDLVLLIVVGLNTVNHTYAHQKHIAQTTRNGAIALPCDRLQHYMSTNPFARPHSQNDKPPRTQTQVCISASVNATASRIIS
jgi:hypothetical protein